MLTLYFSGACWWKHSINVALLAVDSLSGCVYQVDASACQNVSACPEKLARTQCAVCMESMGLGARVMTMECSSRHTFHHECIRYSAKLATAFTPARTAYTLLSMGSTCLHQLLDRSACLTSHCELYVSGLLTLRSLCLYTCCLLHSAENLLDLLAPTVRAISLSLHHQPL